jgi:thioredoxin-related protein
MPALANIPRKLFMTIVGETRIFCNKNKLKPYLSTNPALQRILEAKFQQNECNYTQENTTNE